MVKKTKRISPALKSIYPILILIVCFIMGIGYATLDSVSLKISGEMVALMQEGVFITETNYTTSKGIDIVNTNINATSGTLLNSTITLSNTDVTSYVTYTITVLNNYNYKVFFDGTSYSNDFYDNSIIVYELSDNLVEGMILEPHTFITFDITFKYKSGTTINRNDKINNVLNSYISFDFPAVAILEATSSSDTSKFRSETYKKNIKSITFERGINVPSNAIESWDIGVSQTRDVMAYVVNNTTSGYYDLYIQSDTQLYGNENMSYWFNNFTSIDAINGLSLLDTSQVTNMRSMFLFTAEDSTVFTLDVSGFDTSNVTDMGYMFKYTGKSSTVFTLDVSNFDTRKVTTMGSMFCGTGRSSPLFTLDISNFDTSKVRNMSYMFYDVGSSNKNFTLNLGTNFDTSNVSEMNSMFYRTGYTSTKLNISITIKNPNTKYYNDVFTNAAIKSGSRIIVNYTNETSDLVDLMIATKSEESNVVKGILKVDINNIAVGDEMIIGTEKFNVISQTEDTLTMLAQDVLGTNYRQSDEYNYFEFSSSVGWENTPGPKEIDIQVWSTKPKTYVNEYVAYLKSETGENNISGNLITMKELKTLGCTISEDYSFTSGLTCNGSSYKSWLVISKNWWTRSASPDNPHYIWFVGNAGDFGSALGIEIYSGIGVRPIITIPKNLIKLN